MYYPKHKLFSVKLLIVSIVTVIAISAAASSSVFAATPVTCPHNAAPVSGECPFINNNQAPPTNGCGSDPVVLTSIDFGCKGDACVPGSSSYVGDNQVNSTSNYCGNYHNPVIDALFSIIKFLSDGVGIIVVASIIVGGIQFSMARDNPDAAAKARGRIQSSLGALLIYIFAYAILNYLIPAGFFGQ